VHTQAEARSATSISPLAAAATYPPPAALPPLSQMERADKAHQRPPRHHGCGHLQRSVLKVSLLIHRAPPNAWMAADSGRCQGTFAALQHRWGSPLAGTCWPQGHFITLHHTAAMPALPCHGLTLQGLSGCTRVTACLCFFFFWGCSWELADMYMHDLTLAIFSESTVCGWGVGGGAC